MSMVVASRSHAPSGWILWHGSLIFGTRVLSVDEAVRHEWGEACWTARILSEGEAAGRALAAMPRRGCFF